MNFHLIPSKKKFPTLLRLVHVATVCSLAMAPTAAVHASDWTGTGNTVDWSTIYDGVTFTTGWISSVPNGVGTVANFQTNGNSRSVVVNIPVTIGTLRYSGATGGTRTITMTNPLTLNNGGSGALISNETSATSNILSFSSGTFNLADDLRISNTNTALNGSNNAITFGGSALFQGTGNVTFSNAANTTTVAAINWGGTHTFTGNVLIEKGAVIYGSSGNAFGNASNTITLGSSGSGSATLMSTASTPTLANSIVVAAGTGGTLLLGSNSTSATLATYSGAITLNGNVSLMSRRTGVNSVRYTGVISGNGGITTVGDGITQLGNGAASIVNSYKGNTTLTETSAFTLSDNAKITFSIGANGINNKITATGGNNNALTLDGDFVFDLTGAATTVGSSWTIVDVSLVNESFSSSFTVDGFTADLGGVIWTRDINGTSYYQFSEATGVLSVVPEPTAVAMISAGLVLALMRRRRH